MWHAIKVVLLVWAILFFYGAMAWGIDSVLELSVALLVLLLLVPGFYILYLEAADTCKVRYSGVLYMESLSVLLTFLGIAFRHYDIAGNGGWWLLLPVPALIWACYGCGQIYLKVQMGSGAQAMQPPAADPNDLSTWSYGDLMKLFKEGPDGETEAQALQRRRAAAAALRPQLPIF